MRVSRSGEDPTEPSDRAKTTPTLAKVPELVAKELGGPGVVVIQAAVENEEDSFDGSLDAASVELRGSIGGKVFAHGGTSTYACGAAHPYAFYVDTVFDLATREGGVLTADDSLKQKAVAAFKAKRAEDPEKKECWTTHPDIDFEAPDNLLLTYDGGRARAGWLVTQDFGEADRICNFDLEVEAALDASLGFGPVDARVAQRVATKDGKGNFGFATVPADQRNALLELVTSVFRIAFPSLPREAKTHVTKDVGARAPHGRADFGARGVLHIGAWRWQGVAVARPLPERVCTLLAGMFEASGDLSVAQREAVRRFVAARSGGPAMDRADAVPEAWRPLLEKVADAAYRVVDEDFDALRRAGLSEAQLFDLVVCAAVAAGEARMRRVYALLEPPSA